MRRATVNFLVDAAALVVLLALTVTGFIIKYVLPPGSGGSGWRGGRGAPDPKFLWSMTRHQWGDIHYYLAILFVVLVTVHLALHYGWMKSYLKSLRKRRPRPH